MVPAWTQPAIANKKSARNMFLFLAMTAAAFEAWKLIVVRNSPNGYSPSDWILLPNRDREGVTMGLRPTKGDEDA